MGGSRVRIPCGRLFSETGIRWSRGFYYQRPRSDGVVIINFPPIPVPVIMTATAGGQRLQAPEPEHRPRDSYSCAGRSGSTPHGGSVPKLGARAWGVTRA